MLSNPHEEYRGIAFFSFRLRDLSNVSLTSFMGWGLGDQLSQNW